MPKRRALVWIRRDLRMEDHAALAHASTVAEELAVVFVFDSKILKGLPKTDRRVGFINNALGEIDAALRKRSSALIVRVGDPVVEIPKLAKEFGANLVCAARDYEPYAKERDGAVETRLEKAGATLILVKDQVIFEQDEIKNLSGLPYKVFTPYKKNWLGKLKAHHYEERVAEDVAYLPAKTAADLSQPHGLEDIGFVASGELWLPTGSSGAKKLLGGFRKPMENYESARNFPALPGTSALSAHLRFGTISVRACVRAALKQDNHGAKVWLSELIWRDFYQMILDQYPHVAKSCFRPEYDAIRWPGKEAHFEAWCRGETGFPLVDAAMRQLNETGWMHNRMRMVTASFLTKDLLVDYRRGEAYFAEKLLDFDLASNNGGWQWSASTGCDAQPYFRIFNPYSQSERFDAKGDFIRAQVPELRAIKGKQVHQPNLKELPPGTYPKPLVEHAVQRDKAIALFKAVKAIKKNAPVKKAKEL
ncbi:MAG: deoxyribodipyrimidine photo-lyase [Proteobacteria bacterium]|nr:MAG: deoxyribodipyrimidine photo-lyase [Pseudomonadota bacterium]